MYRAFHSGILSNRLIAGRLSLSICVVGDTIPEVNSPHDHPPGPPPGLRAGGAPPPGVPVGLLTLGGPPPPPRRSRPNRNVSLLSCEMRWNLRSTS